MGQDNTKRHSFEMHEIIYAPPPWLVRWGVGLFVLLLSSFISLSVLIRYPDTIETEINIYESGTVSVSAASIDGKVVLLAVRDSQKVKAGEAMLYLQKRGVSKQIDTVFALQTGVAHIMGILQNGQLVKKGRLLFYITNKGDGQYYGELSVPQTYMRQLKKNQQVLIKLKAYAVEEFGVLTGIVDSISRRPVNGHYFTARVRLTKPTNRKINLVAGMDANAMVITGEKTLMDRIISKIMHVPGP